MTIPQLRGRGRHRYAGCNGRVSSSGGGGPNTNSGNRLRRRGAECVHRESRARPAEQAVRATDAKQPSPVQVEHLGRGFQQFQQPHLCDSLPNSRRMYHNHSFPIIARITPPQSLSISKHWPCSQVPTDLTALNNQCMFIHRLPLRQDPLFQSRIGGLIKLTGDSPLPTRSESSGFCTTPY